MCLQNVDLAKGTDGYLQIIYHLEVVYCQWFTKHMLLLLRTILRGGQRVTSLFPGRAGKVQAPVPLPLFLARLFPLLFALLHMMLWRVVISRVC